MPLYTEILPNQKYILEDITAVLYSGNAYYHSVQIIFLQFPIQKIWRLKCIEL